MKEEQIMEKRENKKFTMKKEFSIPPGITVEELEKKEQISMELAKDKDQPQTKKKKKVKRKKVNEE